MSYSLETVLEGASFLGRAVYAAALSLVFETQLEGVRASHVRRALALSDEAWADAYAELNSLGIMWGTTEDGFFIVEISTGADLLRRSIGAPGRPSAKEWEELREIVFDTHGRACMYCSADDKPLAVDHIVALTLGGSNHPTNLLPACKSCNSAKGGKTWEDWYAVMERRRR